MNFHKVNTTMELVSIPFPLKNTFCYIINCFASCPRDLPYPFITSEGTWEAVSFFVQLHRITAALHGYPILHVTGPL